jgi:hypothetical protein
MENPNTWTLLHHDLARASRNVFHSTEQKAEVLAQVLINHKLDASQEEVLAVILSYAESIEEGRCGLSLPATIVNAFQKQSS